MRSPLFLFATAVLSEAQRRRRPPSLRDSPPPRLDCFVVPCPLATAQYPASAPARSSEQQKEELKKKASCGRFARNVYHQIAEVALPMFYLAVAANATPRAIWWRFELLPLTRELLGALFPSTRLVVGDNHNSTAAAAKHFGDAACRLKPHRVRASVARGPFPRLGRRSAEAARRAVFRRCERPKRKSKADIDHEERPTVVLLERENARRAPHCAGRVSRRGLDAGSAAALRTLLERRGLRFETRRVPLRAESLCAQVARFSRLAALVSVHGAHLVNALFLPSRAVLVEIRPFGCFGLDHYRRLVAESTVDHVLACAASPFAASTSGAACAKNQTCREVARDCFAARLPTTTTLFKGHQSCVRRVLLDDDDDDDNEAPHACPSCVSTVASAVFRAVVRRFGVV